MPEASNASLNSYGSIDPDPSLSKISKAYLTSNTSSFVRCGGLAKSSALKGLGPYGTGGGFPFLGSIF
jgi:hypothetical protein